MVVNGSPSLWRKACRASGGMSFADLPVDFALMLRQAPPIAVALTITFVAAALSSWGSVADAAASVPVCRTVRASGGDYNGGGGTMYAEVKIANTASQTCVVSGRPWIKLPRLPHPVTVEDLTGSVLAGDAGRRVILRPRQSAHAFILVIPGSCDRGTTVSFALRAVAGWRNRGVEISGVACNNGSATIAVGSFQK